MMNNEGLRKGGPLNRRVDDLNAADRKILRPALRRLSLERDLAVSLISINHFDQAWEIILKASLQCGGIDGNALWIFDPDLGQWYFAAGQGLCAELEKAAPIFNASSPDGRLFMEGQTIHGSFRSVFPELDEGANGGGLRALAMVPVRQDGRIRAVLAVGSKTEKELSPESLRLSEFIAASIGHVLKRFTGNPDVGRQDDTKERLRLIVDNMTDIVTLIDRDFHVLYNSLSYEAITGYPLNDKKKKLAFDRVIPEDVPKVQEALEQAAVTLSSGKIEYRYRHERGDEIWLETTGTPLVNSNREFMGIVLNTRDITDRKLMEEALRDSEERFRRLYESSFGGIVIHDKGIIIEANQSLATMSGYGLSELIGMSSNLLISPDFHAQAIKKVREDDDRAYEAVGVRKDGSTYPVEIRGKKVPYHGQQVRMTEFRDLTDRKKIENIMQETLDKLEYRVQERTVELREANTALRIVLNQRLEDQRILEERLQANINELVIPIINELRSDALGQRTLSCLNLLESNLQNVLSPFLNNLASAFRNLTPKEIRVAGMIQEGLFTKQIAELMGIRKSTVDTHRDNLRTKLGLKNGKTNLRSYLLSIK